MSLMHLKIEPSAVASLQSDAPLKQEERCCCYPTSTAGASLIPTLKKKQKTKKNLFSLRMYLLHAHTHARSISNSSEESLDKLCNYVLKCEARGDEASSMFIQQHSQPIPSHPLFLPVTPPCSNQRARGAEWLSMSRTIHPVPGYRGCSASHNKSEREEEEGDRGRHVLSRTDIFLYLAQLCVCVCVWICYIIHAV